MGKAVKPVMLAQGGGAIGVTGATASWRGAPMTPAFASAKFAMRGLTQSLSKELGPRNIHVFHVIIDGPVASDTTGAPPNAGDKPLEEFLRPSGIAETYWHMVHQPKTAWSWEVHLASSAAMSNMCTI